MPQDSHFCITNLQQKTAVSKIAHGSFEDCVLYFFRWAEHEVAGKVTVVNRETIALVFFLSLESSVEV